MVGRRTRDNVTVACANCGAQDAIQIEITLPDDTDVTFNSCHRCEHRWWESASGVIDLNAVLEKARRR
jgi:DNA-directed RNA polymerase subunit M/transcription elongation factor TFIIS